MLITKTSALTGATHTREIAVTQAQIDAWKNGALIQDAMPNLSVDDREFLMTGSTPEEWTEAFGESAGDEDPYDKVLEPYRNEVANFLANRTVLAAALAAADSGNSNEEE